MTTTCYDRCARMFAKRRKSNDWKRISHNQVLFYDEQQDCYEHKHHATKTVFIYRDKYRVTTGGWDTITTWTKIREFCPLRAWKPSSTLMMDDRVIYWAGGTKFAPYYDGIELDGDGIPLNPKPCTFRHHRNIHKRMVDAFDANVATVRTALLTRMLVGEWDGQSPRMLPPPSLVVELFGKVAHTKRKWLDADLVAPLFMRTHADRDEPFISPSVSRFNNMVEYARTAPELAETYLKECF